MWSAVAERSGDAALAPREALPSCWRRLGLEEKRRRRFALPPHQRSASRSGRAPLDCAGLTPLSDRGMTFVTRWRIESGVKPPHSIGTSPFRDDLNCCVIRDRSPPRIRNHGICRACRYRETHPTG